MTPTFLATYVAVRSLRLLKGWGAMCGFGKPMILQWSFKEIFYNCSFLFAMMINRMVVLLIRSNPNR